MPDYRLTERSFEALKKYGFSKTALQGLKSLANQTFRDESSFTASVESSLGEAFSTAYLKPVLEHAELRKYRAFISYSHEGDAGMARAIQVVLHKLAKPWYKIRAFKVYRDETDLNAQPDFWRAIQDALDNSEYFILLASPEAADSKWVRKETEYWLKNRSKENLILVLTDGRIHWPDSAGSSDISPGEAEDFDWQTTSALPEVFKGQYCAAPKYVDLRKFRSEKDLSNKNSGFKEEVATFAATLHGKSRDNIISEEVAQMGKTKKLVMTVLSVILLLVSLTVYSVVASRRDRQAGIQARFQRMIATAFENVYRNPAQSFFDALEAKRLCPLTSADAVRRQQSESAELALRSAYKTLILHKENNKIEMELSGKGAAYLAPRFRRLGLYSKLSPDGKYALSLTRRSKDGSSVPGKAYLLNNESLETIELNGCSGRASRRLETGVFSTSGKEIFIVRQFNLEVYGLDGSCRGEFRFSRFTKAPVHTVAGYLGDYIIGGDGTGGVWLVAPKTGKSLTFMGEWAGDPLIRSVTDASGKYAVVVLESGKAFFLTLDESEELVAKELSSGGVSNAVFSHALRNPYFLTMGEKGRVQLWQALDTGPVNVKTLKHGNQFVHYGSFSKDHEHLLTISDDQTVNVWKTDATHVDTIERNSQIDWVALRGLPCTLFSPPAVRYPETGITLKPGEFKDWKELLVDGEKWLVRPGACPPAYRIENGTAIPYPDGETDIGFNTTEIVQGPGQFWLFRRGFLGSGRAYRIIGKRCIPFPSKDTNVYRILLKGNKAWLATEYGAYCAEGETYTRLTPPDLRVNDIFEIDERLWLATEDGAFRVEQDKAVRISGYMNVVEIKKAGGHVWFLTREDNELFASNGPLYRCSGGYHAVPALDHEIIVKQVQEIDGRAYLSTNHGGYIQEGDRFIKIEGCDLPGGRFEKHGDALWFLVDGLNRDLLFRIRDNKAELFPAPGDLAWDITDIGGKTWMKTVSRSADGYRDIAGPAYRLEDGGTVPYPTREALVSEIYGFGNQVWFSTRTEEGHAGPAYHIRNSGVEILPAENVRVESLHGAGGSIWMRVKKENYSSCVAVRIDGDALSVFDFGRNSVSDIQSSGGRVWFNMAKGSYRVDADTAIPSESAPLDWQANLLPYGRSSETEPSAGGAAVNAIVFQAGEIGNKQFPAAKAWRQILSGTWEKEAELREKEAERRKEKRALAALYTSVTEGLLADLKSPRPVVRRIGLERLFSISKMLAGENGIQRFWIKDLDMEALSKVISLQTIANVFEQPLWETIKDASWYNRWLSVKLLKYYRKQIDLPVNLLLDALFDGERMVRIEALRAIKVTPLPPSALRPLVQVLEAGDKDMGTDIVSVIASLKENAAPAIPSLLKFYDRGDMAARKAVIRALGSIGPEAKEGLGRLEACTRHENRKVRKMARQAIVKINIALERRTGQAPQPPESG